MSSKIVQDTPATKPRIKSGGLIGKGLLCCVTATRLEWHHRDRVSRAMIARAKEFTSSLTTTH